MGLGFRIKKQANKFPKGIQTYTNSTTIKVPIGSATVDVFAVGGGGGAGGFFNFDYTSESSTRINYRYGNFYGGGGGSGRISQISGRAVSAGQSVAIAIGGSGSQGSSGYYYYVYGEGSEYTAANNGTSGGTTTVSIAGTTVVSAAGGDGGQRTSTKGSPIYYSNCTSHGGAGASGGGGGNCYFWIDNEYSSYQTVTEDWDIYAGSGGVNGATGVSGKGSKYVHSYNSQHEEKDNSPSVTTIYANNGGSGQGSTTKVFGTQLLTASGQDGKGSRRTDISPATVTGYGDGGGRGAVFIWWHRA